VSAAGKCAAERRASLLRRWAWPMAAQAGATQSRPAAHPPPSPSTLPLPHTWPACPASPPSSRACGPCRCRRPAQRAPPAAAATPPRRPRRSPAARRRRRTAAGARRRLRRRGGCVGARAVAQRLPRSRQLQAPSAAALRRRPTSCAMLDAVSYRCLWARGQSTTALMPSCSCVLAYRNITCAAHTSAGSWWPPQLQGHPGLVRPAAAPGEHAWLLHRVGQRVEVDAAAGRQALKDVSRIVLVDERPAQLGGYRSARGGLHRWVAARPCLDRQASIERLRTCSTWISRFPDAP
jgi:hypothetical protein